MKLEPLFIRFPHLEALARNIYWRVPAARKLDRRAPKVDAAREPIAFDAVLNEFRRLGVRPDDVVLIHSSMKELAPTGLPASEIVERLLTELVPAGTLVCPAFPLYANEPDPAERLTADISKLEFVYDVQKTRTWTGDLGKVLMKRSGARRSVFPLNTIAASGAHVAQIFADDTVEKIDMPCGPNSPWPKLVELNAKILMVGVDIAHSLTMIHVAEDCHEREWPIKDWYRPRHFRVRSGGTETRVTLRERQPKWSMSYAERRLDSDLREHGIARMGKVGSLRIAYLESAKLLAFLNARKAAGYPYYLASLSAI